MGASNRRSQKDEFEFPAKSVSSQQLFLSAPLPSARIGGEVDSAYLANYYAIISSRAPRARALFAFERLVIVCQSQSKRFQSSTLLTLSIA